MDNKQKKYNTHYIWDITTDSKDTNIYKVEYKGKKDKISYTQLEVATNRARRKAFELTGNRKALTLSNDGFSTYEKGHRIIKVSFDTKPLKKWVGKQRKPIAEFEFGEEIDFDFFIEDLEQKMGENTFWKIDGKNIDWQGRSGSKVTKAKNGQELLEAIYNEEILRLYCGKNKNCFEINAPTHDTPTGSFYHFTPISEKVYNKEI